MAANRQQGSYLMVFLVGFTTFVAGLAAWSGHPGIGVVATLAGLVLLIISLVGFMKIKRLEFTE
jgi:hypothetical protein